MKERSVLKPTEDNLTLVLYKKYWVIIIYKWLELKIQANKVEMYAQIIVSFS